MSVFYVFFSGVIELLQRIGEVGGAGIFWLQVQGHICVRACGLGECPVMCLHVVV